MNLVSCNNCGVVLDKNKLKFPDDIYKDDGCVDTGKGVWDSYHDVFVPFVKCPACSEPVKGKE